MGFRNLQEKIEKQLGFLQIRLRGNINFEIQLLATSVLAFRQDSITEVIFQKIWLLVYRVTKPLQHCMILNDKVIEGFNLNQMKGYKVI